VRSIGSKPNISFYAIKNTGIKFKPTFDFSITGKKFKPAFDFSITVKK